MLHSQTSLLFLKLPLVVPLLLLLLLALLQLSICVCVCVCVCVYIREYVRGTSISVHANNLLRRLTLASDDG